jgi:hypothetical protein
MDTLNVSNQMLESKTSLDKFKTCMEKCFDTAEMTETFITYAINDVVALKGISKQMTFFMNDIIHDLEIHNSKNKKYNSTTNRLFTMENIPSSNGALVGELLKAFLTSYFAKLNLGEEFLKANQLWAVDKNLKSNRKLSEKPKKQKRIGDTETGDSDIEKEYSFGGSKDKVSSLIGGCSAKSFLNINRRDTAIYNALTQGGRTYSEEPQEYIHKNTFDVDIASCYPTALRVLEYPIGLPTKVAFVDRQKKMTFREFLDIYEKELVNGLYTITISGKLTFSQTLLYSKLTTSSGISESFEKNDDDQNDIGSGDFLILTNELVNTHITSDVLEVLRKCCSTSELREIYSCIVETAIFYKKSDRRSPEHFFEELGTHDRNKTYYYETKIDAIVDKRPKIWTSVPLKDLFDPLIKLRKEKKELFNKKINTQENKGKQLLIKNITNTIYGVIASPFFEVGNTILANNTTAKARVYIWLTSRCMRGIQCITDGFQYQPSKILAFKRKYTRKPSLSVLSNYKKLEKNRSIKMTSLGDIDWDPLFAMEKELNELPPIDNAINAHVDDFLKPYNLKIPYNLEHKIENIALKTFSIKKAHNSNHLLRKENLTQETKEKVEIIRHENVDKIVSHKYRGNSPGSPGLMDRGGGAYSKETPIFYRMSYCLFWEITIEIESLESYEKRIISIQDYQNSKKNEGLTEIFLPGNTIWLKKNEILLPGDTIWKKKIFRLTNQDLRCRNRKEWEMLKKNPIDYASMIPLGVPISKKDIEQILDKRYQDHEEFFMRKIDLENKKTKKK